MERAQRGLVDADLGGGLIKQRVARTGQGRAAGFRMLLAFHREYRSVFLYAFAKNARENVTEDELQTLRELGAAWLRADRQTIIDAIQDGALQEIRHGNQDPTDPDNAGSARDGG